MNALRSLSQSAHFQRFRCVAISTVCTVACLALAYFCIEYGLGFEKHGKIIGDLAIQWRGTCLEIGASTYAIAMLVNVAVILRRIFVTDSKYNAPSSLAQVFYSLGSPIFVPYLMVQHLKKHGHEHLDLILRHTYFKELLCM